MATMADVTNYAVGTNGCPQYKLNVMEESKYGYCKKLKPQIVVWGRTSFKMCHCTFNYLM